jgi:hypothetical protein
MAPTAALCLATLLVSASGRAEVFEQVAPDVWTGDGVHFASPNGAALQNFTGFKVGNCDTYASDQDVYNIHKETVMTNLCINAVGCGGNLDAWHTNMDGHETCVEHGVTAWSGGQPKTGARQLDCQTLTNNGDDAATLGPVTLDGSHSDSVMVGLTTTSSFAETIAVQVEIPEVMKVTSQFAFTVTSSSTTQQTSTNTNGHSNSVSATVPAHSSKCATIGGTSVEYNQNFEVPVCLRGQFRCQYSSPCNGHYYWYVSLGSNDVCSNMKGYATSSTVTEVTSTIDEGVCPSGCEKFKVVV